MTELTEIILQKHNEETESVRKFLQRMGITQQKWYNWKKGAIPEDKILQKVSETLNIDFLFLISAARMYDMSSNTETRNEWRKIYNQKKSELSRKKQKVSFKFEGNITGNLD